MQQSPPIDVVLHQPEIPQNTGTIGRSCVAVGAKLWLVRPLGFRLDDHYLRRAGLDYWQHLQWEVVDDWSALSARLAGRRIWLFSKSGNRVHTTVPYAAGDVLVFGSETQGLPASLLKAHRESSVRIPITPEARSLNLACAASVAVYEAMRHIGFAGETAPQ